jgi:DNA-binding NtrC family response regulator
LDVFLVFCFTIYFPVFTGNVIKSSVPEKINLNGNEKIIIVDDEVVVAGSLNALLKKHGYSTHVFTCSKQALDMISTGKIKGDLLITDLTMPEVSGIDLINEISKSFPELPIILCTGYNDMYSKEKIDRSKIISLMIKPVNIEDLLKTIRSAFEKKTESQSNTQ